MILESGFDAGNEVVLRTDGRMIDPAGRTVRFAAHMDWGGRVNPMIAGLPNELLCPLRDDPECLSVVTLILNEAEQRRCGADAVLSRLCEVLLVRILRRQLAQGMTRPGVLAGLADPRLARAIVVIHDRPGHLWSIEDLAAEAGLSRSHFSDVFAHAVGESPSSYLRRWRLIVARQDLAKGDRVERVAHRYGYHSAEGFSRAFRRQFGDRPIDIRQGAGIAYR
ncbi:MAG: AraC family transcriptional regulator [Rhodobacteraceae bacterium]|nr:AraC family transcriptional regulator [Paracoccaceae bacterium]